MREKPHELLFLVAPPLPTVSWYESSVVKLCKFYNDVILCVV